MANPFVRGWKYFMALLSGKLDEHADPKIQIQQAIEEAQRQHQTLTQQAAAVIGNQRQLEMKLARQMSEVEKLQASARQALVLADKARAEGDEAKAQQYEQTANTFATQLVAGEQSMEDLKNLHDQALGAAEQAKKAVENNAMQVQQKLAERSQLLTQLEQAKMQEQVSASLSSMSELSAPGSTPNLNEVRDKIEARYAKALGSAELAQNSVEGRMLEVQKSTLEMAGTSRLEQIRASMGAEQAGDKQLSAPTATPELAAGDATTTPAAEGETDSSPDHLTRAVPSDDRQLAKRLTREAEIAARRQARAEKAYAKAVARRERKLREARRALPIGVGTAVVGTGASVLAFGGDGHPVLWGVVAFGAYRAVSAARTLRRPPPLPHRPTTPLPAPPPPPSPSSVAFPAVKRLEQVRDTLARLLPLVSPAGRAAADEAWQAAAESDLALRWQAARLAAVEHHRGADPALLAELMSGVAAQERLVDAVVELVAASADALESSRLQDATDAVHGLAQGLREVR